VVLRLSIQQRRVSLTNRQRRGINTANNQSVKNKHACELMCAAAATRCTCSVAPRPSESMTTTSTGSPAAVRPLMARGSIQIPCAARQ
jgi:hypothetical protein